MTIRDTIKWILKNEMPLQSMACTVKSVDESKSVCDVEPLDGSADILDVLLLAEQSDKIGLIKIPAVDSIVYVTFISKDIAFVSLISEITKVSIKIKDISLTIDENEILLNGDSLGGLTKTVELESQLNKMKARITALEGLIQIFATAQEAAAVATPLFAPLSPAWVTLKTGIGSLPAQGDFSDIENKKVKHGN